MRVAKTVAELNLDPTKTIGLVPTMGALHEGHLSLMRTASSENEVSVCSIFVNPTQFGPNEDFARYPRDPDRDYELAASAGVDVVFAPEVREIYPRETTRISVPEVTEQYEGAHRPGHFDGVATVVCKLFNIVRPDVAYFGWKDLQQCAVIRRMVEDLNMPLRVQFQDTVREPDGLAMSSRNRYLSEAERAVAPQLYQALLRENDLLCSSDDTIAAFEATRAELERTIEASGFRLDYIDLVDIETMHPATRSDARLAIVVAARLGKTRLIDNVRLSA